MITKQLQFMCTEYPEQAFYCSKEWGNLQESRERVVLLPDHLHVCGQPLQRKWSRRRSVTLLLHSGACLWLNAGAAQIHKAMHLAVSVQWHFSRNYNLKKCCYFMSKRLKWAHELSSKTQWYYNASANHLSKLL